MRSERNLDTMPTKRLATKDLKTVTELSVKAVLAKRLRSTASVKEGPAPAPDIVTGFVLSPEAVESPNAARSIAREVAKAVGEASGIRVTPKVLTFPGGIVVGYVPPPRLGAGR